MCLLLYTKFQVDQHKVLNNHFLNQLDIITQKKIKKLRFYQDKKRTITGYELLNKGLIMGNFKESLSSIQLNDYGKPFFPSNKTFFNISHSGNYVVCVVSNRNVGIDIQKKTQVSNDLAEYFHNKEILRLEDASVNSWESLFFKYWSVKECYLKYLGLGLSKSLDSFYFDIDNSQIVDPTNDTEDVKITQLNFENEYFLAITHHKDDPLFLKSLSINT